MVEWKRRYILPRYLDIIIFEIEIYRMLETLRNKGPRLELFRPVEDLSDSSDKNRMDGEKVVSELEREAIKVNIK